MNRYDPYLLRSASEQPLELIECWPHPPNIFLQATFWYYFLLRDNPRELRSSENLHCLTSVIWYDILADCNWVDTRWQ